MSDILDQWEKKKEENMKRALKNKPIILKALVDAGFVLAEARYSGSGDCGSFDDIALFTEENTEVGADCREDLKVTVWTGRGTFKNGAWENTVSEETMALEAALRDCAHYVLEGQHPGWENNEGASGKVSFDTKTSKITLEHDAYYTETDHSEYSI